MDLLREEFPQKESYSEQKTMLVQEMMHRNRCVLKMETKNF